MNRTHRIAIATAIGAALVLGLVAGVVAQEFELPKPVPAEEPIPAPQPEDGQQVAVLIVDLESDGERVQAEIVFQDVISSFAPKSVARSRGAWEIRVFGEKELRYHVLNPLLDVEVENPEDVEVPFASVETKSLRWTLVVPLYVDGEPLGAQTIEVVDLVTEEVVLSTEIRSG
jgi:hypothetical protein